MDSINELISIWIEDLEHQSSSTLYKKLIPHYRSVYDNADRFIFYNFSPVQKSTLEHVVNILQYIDISPWFVSVITDQSDTQEYFESLAEPIRVIRQSRSDEHHIVDQVSPVFNTNNHMCAHAWSGFHVYPDGTTRPCCVFSHNLKDDNHQDFNIRQHTIKEIINSKHMNSLREEFRQGKTPAGCATCTAVEKSGGLSKRKLTKFKLENIWGHVDWESDSEQNIGFIGGHLGNLCNLKCRICSETFSSSIATEKLTNNSAEYKNNPVYLTLLNNNWKKHSTLFFDNIKSMPQLRNFEFLGGEPLLVKENIEFLQYLLDNNLSKDCIFEFVTNGTQYHDNVFDRASQFRRLTVTISIDDIGSRFEYQRSGAKWSQLQTNLKKFMSNPDLTIGISITVNIQNVLYLPELVSWLLSQGVSDYAYNMLHYPAWACVKKLTDQGKQLVINKLTNSGLPTDHQERLNFVIDTIKNSSYSDGQDFIKNIKLVDNIRGENFVLTHPEIAKAMGFN